MSKFAKVLVALVAIAAFAAPAFAADNFSVSGQYNLFGTYQDNDVADGSTHTWGYQKLRIYGIFKANDKVNVQFRSDLSEGNWGADSDNGRQFPGSGKTFADLDRAFLEIKLDSMTLRGGTQYVGFGKTQAFSYNDTGLMVALKSVPLTLTYAVLDDNDAADGSISDAWVAGAKFSTNGMDLYAAIDKNQTEQVYVLGASYGAKYDALNVAAEVNFFTGDATATADATGLTAFADVSTALSDTTTVGGAAYYAAGDDDTSATGDVAYTLIGSKFGTWDAFTRGPFADENYAFAKRPFDALGAEAGIMAFQGYADVKTSDMMTVGGSIVYAAADEDTVASADSMVLVSAYASYALTDNVGFHNGVQFVSYDKTTAQKALSASESNLSIMTGLIVKF